MLLLCCVLHVSMMRQHASLRTCAYDKGMLLQARHTVCLQALHQASDSWIPMTDVDISVCGYQGITATAVIIMQYCKG